MEFIAHKSELTALKCALVFAIRDAARCLITCGGRILNRHRENIGC
jgi:hypothetical protein